MPRLTASLEQAENLAPLPKTDQSRPPYRGHVSAEKMEFSKKTGAPMVCLQFEVDEDDYRGRQLPGMNGWYYIMAGGKRENGELHDLSRLFDTINFLGAEWTCTSCSNTSTQSFVKEKIKASYQYHCPHCGARADVSLDSSWIGLSCRIGVDIEKMQGSDNDRNVITRLYPRND